AGLADLAQRLRDGTRADPCALSRVVVVGETKRGKSSLVNALVGRPLLSPVGDDVVTATYIVLTPIAPPELDRAVALLADPETGAPRRVPIELGELADYVSVDAIHEGVIGAEVYVDALLLQGIEITDTPGVGGLQRGHSAVTMATLDTTHVMLFVMDACAPLSLPELRFLTQAARRIDTVVLAMTKIDLCPEWEAISKQDRALFAVHAPQLAEAPIIGVSSRLAEQASLLGADSSETATTLRRISGLEPLVEELRTRVTGRSKVVSDAHRAQILRALLTKLRAQIGEQPEHLAGDPARLAALVAERDRLRAYLLDQRTGAVDAQQRIHRVRRDAQRDFDLQASSLIERYSALIETCPIADLKEIPTLLEGELAQVVAGQLENVGAELSDIVDGLQVRLGSVNVLNDFRQKLAEEVKPEISRYSGSPGHVEHLIPAAGEVITASSILLVGSFVSVGTVGIAICVAAVVTIGFKQFFDSRTTTRRQSLRLWLDRVGRDVRRSFDGACGQRFEALERVLSFEFPRLLDDRVTQIDRLTTASGTAATTATGPAPVDVDDLLARTSAFLTPTGTS
ncbi:MAG: dynamin family protein, partial [Pseudonocardiaceae bacterium]